MPHPILCTQTASSLSAVNSGPSARPPRRSRICCVGCLLSVPILIAVAAIAAEVSPHQVVGVCAVFAIVATAATALPSLRKLHPVTARCTFGIFLACDLSGAIAYQAGSVIPTTHAVFGAIATALLGTSSLSLVARRYHRALAGLALAGVVVLIASPVCGAP